MAPCGPARRCSLLVSNDAIVLNLAELKRGASTSVQRDCAAAADAPQPRQRHVNVPSPG